MVCVFGSFIFSDIRPRRMFGLGMATAVFVDATLVRMARVPSVMHLLGRTAWAMPRWLNRVLPDPHIDEVRDRTERHMTAANETATSGTKMSGLRDSGGPLAGSA